MGSILMLPISHFERYPHIPLSLLLIYQIW